jgi:hypothetical protein
MLAYEGEKYVSKINDTFIPHKDPEQPEPIHNQQIQNGITKL